MKTLLLLPAALLTAAGTTPTHAALPKPLLEVRFNGEGVTAAASPESSIQPGLNLLDATGAANDLHSQPGQGVSGADLDKALDLSSGPQMGLDQSNPDVKGPVAKTDSYAEDLGGLKSFTVAMWFRGDGEAIARLARLIEIAPQFGQTSTLALMGSTGAGSLRFALDVAVGAETMLLGDRHGLFNDPSKWYFVALTFSGAEQRIRCMTGGVDSAVAEVSSHQVEQTGFLDAPAQICIGNLAKQTRSFRGLIDNVRIYGSKTDDSGALDLEQLERIRTEDLDASRIRP